jgi:hypothetical protein
MTGLDCHKAFDISSLLQWLAHLSTITVDKSVDDGQVA